MKVEFPLGPRTVIMSRPTEGQAFAFAVTRKPREGDGPAVRLRFTQRIVQFLEALAGPEQWAVVEDELMSGDLRPQDLLSLFEDVASFDWAGAAEAQEPEHAAAPATVDVTEKRPAPRVVSGG